MENKINIAEILKDCPKGMELDCTAFLGSVTFDGLDKGNKYPIRIRVNKDMEYLDCYGRVIISNSVKCVIFPKGKTTWEGFVPPCQLEDGKIVATNNGLFIGIIKVKNNRQVGAYCSIDYSEDFRINSDYWFDRMATEEEKQKLFNVIKDNGYEWNPETKTLEKLIEPKFKVGDKIKKKNSDNVHILEITAITPKTYIFRDGSFQYVEIVDKDYELINEPKFKVGDRVKHISAYTSGIVIKVVDKGYYIDYPTDGGIRYISFSLEKDYELVPNKFDITALVPFESKVLVRNDINQLWIPAFWGYKRDNGYATTFGWCQYCIPYEGNQHLLGTTNDYDDFYKTWEK